MQLTGMHLQKSLGKKEIVRDVSISIQTGEAVGIFGPNGAGKTTCFLVLAGVLTPDSGSIFLDRQDITSLPLYQKARLGLRYLPQEPSVFRGMTVEQNILAILELLEPDKNRRRETLETLISDFHLQAVRKSSVRTLSGGERRRVEIARSLVGNPCFLLLDEPCAGIDPKSIEDLRVLIQQVTRRNIGVLITDHNVRDTLKIVTRGYILHQGRILQEGTPEELAQSPEVREVYLGHSFSL